MSSTASSFPIYSYFLLIIKLTDYKIRYVYKCFTFFIFIYVLTFSIIYYNRCLVKKNTAIETFFNIIYLQVTKIIN